MPFFRLSPADYAGLHRRYNEILGSAPILLEGQETPFDTEKLSELFNGMMKVLFKQTGTNLDIDILGTDEAQEFIDAHASMLDSAFESVRMTDVMRQRLQKSDWIFSGIKTFHELNEAFPSLLDENGDRKPFERFLNDVLSIDKTYNRNYLRAEYNFVQSSAEMAAKWEQYAGDGDRYLLQYRTAGDERVRPAHAALNGITLPRSDEFWNSYYPPNGWNCRCTVVQVRKSKYPETPHEEAMSRGEEALADDKKGIFRFNSGKEQKTVPDYNAYTIRRCRDCDVAKGKTELSWVPENELCAACRLIHQAQNARTSQRLTQTEFSAVTNKVKEWALNNLPTVTIRGVEAKKDYLQTSDSHIIGISRKFFNETAAKNKRNPEMAHVMKTAIEYKKWLPSAAKIRTETGRHHPCNFNVYTVKYLGETIEFKTMVTTEENLYVMKFI